jgi:hypothetical protein
MRNPRPWIARAQLPLVQLLCGWRSHLGLLAEENLHSKLALCQSASLQAKLTSQRDQVTRHPNDANNEAAAHTPQIRW